VLEQLFNTLFSELAVAWEQDEIPDRWSLEWEGLEAERKKQIQEVLEIYDF